MDETEIILSVIELCFTFIGLALVIFGWIIPYKQSVKEEKRQRKFEEDLLKRQWKRELIDKQISDFYGPISALIKEKDVMFSLVLYQLGKKYVFNKQQWKLSDLSLDEQKVWIHYVDNYLLPIQRKILNIIAKDQHLIYKSEVPICFETFREYALGWELLDNQKRQGVPNYYEYYYSYNYPKAFTDYINSTLSTLWKIQIELMNVDDKT